MDAAAEQIPLSLDDIGRFLVRLAIAVSDADDGERFDRIALLESVKAACAGAQIDPTVALDASAEAAGSGIECDGTTIRRTGHRRSTASTLGLARKTSPTKGAQWVTVATVLAGEMPCTRRLVSTGKLTERRAEILVRETTGLTDDERREIDRRLCSDPSTLHGCGDRAVGGRARALAIELNSKAVVDRAKKAQCDRRVTVSPAPDAMAYLTALLPMKIAVSVWATLRRDSDAIVAAGQANTRTRDQIMADLLMNRVLGIDSASEIPMTVNVVISDRSLLGMGSEPAHVSGFGPVPADIVFDGITDPEAHVDIRRIYAAPETGDLVAVESKSRIFPAGLARWIGIRDQVCRTPWCGAPIRHIDHIVEHARNGPTSADNAAGLCAHCNQVKNHPGWSAAVVPGSQRHTYEIVTPSGRSFVSTAPALPAPQCYPDPSEAA